MIAESTEFIVLCKLSFFLIQPSQVGLNEERNQWGNLDFSTQKLSFPLVDKMNNLTKITTI